jgi:hypothetical protein
VRDYFDASHVCNRQNPSPLGLSPLRKEERRNSERVKPYLLIVHTKQALIFDGQPPQNHEKLTILRTEKDLSECF